MSSTTIAKPPLPLWRRIFSWICGCIRSQKRTLTVLSLIVGGLTLFTATLTQDSSRNNSSKSANKRLERHFVEIQETCTNTTRTISLAIQKDLSKKLGLPSQRELKQAESLPKEEKLAVWDRFKITSFSRCLSQIYCTCLLAVQLRVQMNLIGRYMYLGACSETDYELSDVSDMQFPTDWTHRQYLMSSSYLVEVGVDILIERVKSATEKVLSKWPLVKKVGDREVHEIVDEIRSYIEGESPLWYIQILFPPERDDVISTEYGSIRLEDSPIGDQIELEGAGTGSESESESGRNGWDSFSGGDEFGRSHEDEKRMLELLMNETRDLAECSEFREVLADGLKRCFSNFYDLLDIAPIISAKDNEESATTAATATATATEAAAKAPTDTNKPQSKSQTIARLVLSLGKMIVTMSSEAEQEILNESVDSMLGDGGSSSSSNSRNHALESIMASNLIKNFSYLIFTSVQ